MTGDRAGAAGAHDVARVGGLLRELAPQVLAALARRHGRFDQCEDAVQEALLDAATRWPTQGLPHNPAGWLRTVAERRLVDRQRADIARERREQRAAVGEAAPGTGTTTDAGDDTLTLLFLCCHPALSVPSQIALTLRAVGGLTTAEIARAFLVPEATMAQRVSRAKATIREAGLTFTLPDPAELDARLRAVRHVLYLVFTEGSTASGGDQLQRTDLSSEAIRLARLLHRLRPDDGETAGLLALMVLTDARRDARSGPGGELVPLADQDRARWDRALIDEGAALVLAALERGDLGPYLVQAAIAAVHDEAPSPEATDWPQILGLYDLLVQMAPGPVVELNRAVAVAEVRGAAAGLALLDELEGDRRLARHHRFHAVRGHLLERTGRLDQARASFELAVRHATSLPERRHLEGRAAALRDGPA